MSNIAIIYREISDSNGNVVKIEPIELDYDLARANKIAKLYNLQTPKSTISEFFHKTLVVRVTE